MRNSQKAHRKIILGTDYTVGLNNTNKTRVIKIYTYSLASIFHSPQDLGLSLTVSVGNNYL